MLHCLFQLNKMLGVFATLFRFQIPKKRTLKCLQLKIQTINSSSVRFLKSVIYCMLFVPILCGFVPPLWWYVCTSWHFFEKNESSHSTGAVVLQTILFFILSFLYRFPCTSVQSRQTIHHTSLGLDLMAVVIVGNNDTF